MEEGFIVIKKMMIFTVVAALLVVVVTGVSQEAGDNKPRMDKHKDRGATCAVCHGDEVEPKDAAPPKSCLTCKNHDSWKTVTERTNSDKGYKFNPHHNHITEANEVECTHCHQEHKADTVFCYNCHTAMKFK